MSEPVQSSPLDDIELDGFSEETPESAPRAVSTDSPSAEFAPEGPAGAEAPTETATPPDIETVTRERDEAHGRAVRHYRELQEMRHHLAEYQRQFGEIEQRQQQAAAPEQPPEWDPDNPAPYLRYQTEMANRRVEMLEQMLTGQHQQALAERQAGAIAAIDNDGAHRTLRALGMVEGFEPDPEYRDAHRYVMIRSRDEIMEQLGCPAEEAQVRLAQYSQAWTRQQMLAGKDPIATLKAHARRIGWTYQAPAESGNGVAQPAAAAARQPSTAVFRRPQTPRGAGGGAGQPPKISDFASEDDYFDALDSGLLTREQAYDQIVIERPGVV